ncbi:MAG: flagellar M-ring protein FliF [Gammaproteobacteria bacterium]|nr:flagellar M-ring protein FliF [Gammaproteobacteria bacterium]
MELAAVSEDDKKVVEALPEELRNVDKLPASLDGFLGLPLVRQVALMVSTAISIALIVVVVMWSNKPDYIQLLGSVDSQDISDAVLVMQRYNIDHMIEPTSGALMVSSNQVHQARMKLASEGLPRNNSGYGMELLEKKPEFGTSQFHELKRYQLALEGELARSITTLKSVKSARVHLALPKQSVFVRKEKRASASVLLDLFGGRKMDEAQVSAIAHMVSSSIPNLEAENVTIVDQHGNLLSKRESASGLDVSQEQLKYAQTVEDLYIDSIVDILSPIVGMDKIRAQVSANLDFSATEKTMESYNPDLPALRSSQSLEESRANGGAVQGVPGALSNQPPGAGNAPEATDGVNGGGAGSDGLISNRRENTSNYELDRTISHTKQAVGILKRLTVAVVIDNVEKKDEEGNIIYAQRTPEEMEQMLRLVRETVGYTPQRGDSVDVINIGFAGREEIPMAKQEIWEQSWFMPAVKSAAGVVIVLIFFLAVIRPMLKTLADNKEMRHVLLAEKEFGLTAEMIAAGGVAGVGGAAGGGMGGAGGRGAGGGGAGGVGGVDGLDDDVLALGSDGASADDGVVKLPGDGTYKENIKVVTGVIKEDPDLAAQVIMSWINEE